MIVNFDKSFSKSIDKLKNKAIADRVIRFIEDWENVTTLGELKHVKKLKGYQFYYRYRIGDYRIGFEKNNEDEITLITIAKRNDIYKVFP